MSFALRNHCLPRAISLVVTRPSCARYAFANVNSVARRLTTSRPVNSPNVQQASGGGGESRNALGLFAGAGVGALLGLYYYFAYSGKQDKPATAGEPGTARERTFIAVKPDGTQRGIVGEIMVKFEERGYKLVALKLLQPTEEKAKTHYEDLKSKPFYPGLVRFFSSGPIVAMVWQGKDAIKTGRVILGATNPLTSSPGTIRGDFAVDVGRNVCHGSDSVEGAKHEIGFWFRNNELIDWSATNDTWVTEQQSSKTVPSPPPPPTAPTVAVAAATATKTTTTTVAAPPAAATKTPAATVASPAAAVSTPARSASPPAGAAPNARPPASNATSTSNTSSTPR